jgi:hypothetical protein
MTNKPKNKSNTQKSLTSAPLNIFADQPSAIQIGPYVTKFTLGVIEEDDDEYPRPVVTVAMPTVNLIRMVTDLHAIFSDPAFKKESAASLTSDIKKHFSTPGHTNAALGPQPLRRLSKAASSK